MYNSLRSKRAQHQRTCGLVSIICCMAFACLFVCFAIAHDEHAPMVLTGLFAFGAFVAICGAIIALLIGTDS